VRSGVARSAAGCSDEPGWCAARRRRAALRCGRAAWAPNAKTGRADGRPEGTSVLSRFRDLLRLAQRRSTTSARQTSWHLRRVMYWSTPGIARTPRGGDGSAGSPLPTCLRRTRLPFGLASSDPRTCREPLVSPARSQRVVVGAAARLRRAPGLPRRADGPARRSRGTGRSGRYCCRRAVRSPAAITCGSRPSAHPTSPSSVHAPSLLMP
jgi:hypothetical protein